MDLQGMLNSKSFYLTKTKIEKGILKEVYIDVKPDKKFIAEEQVPDLNADKQIDGYEILDFLAKNAQDRLKIEFMCQSVAASGSLDERTQSALFQLQDKATYLQYIQKPFDTIHPPEKYDLSKPKDHEFFDADKTITIKGKAYVVSMSILKNDGSYDFLLVKLEKYHWTKDIELPISSVITAPDQTTLLGFGLDAFSIPGDTLLRFKSNEASLIWYKNEPCLSFWLPQDGQVTRSAQDGETYKFKYELLVSANGLVREGTAMNPQITIQGHSLEARDAVLYFVGNKKANIVRSCSFANPLNLMAQKGISYPFISVDSFDAKERVVSGVCVLNKKPYFYASREGIDYFSPIYDDAHKPKPGIYTFTHITGAQCTMSLASYSRGEDLAFTASEKLLWTTSGVAQDITSITVNGNKYSTIAAQISPAGFYNIEYDGKKKETYMLTAADGKNYLLYWPQWDSQTGLLISGYLKNPIQVPAAKGKLAQNIPANTHIAIGTDGLITIVGVEE